jgi:hypothetical protein
MMRRTFSTIVIGGEQYSRASALKAASASYRSAMAAKGLKQEIPRLGY